MAKEYLERKVIVPLLERQNIRISAGALFKSNRTIKFPNGRDVRGIDYLTYIGNPSDEMVELARENDDESRITDPSKGIMQIFYAANPEDIKIHEETTEGLKIKGGFLFYGGNAVFGDGNKPAWDLYSERLRKAGFDI